MEEPNPGFVIYIGRTDNSRSWSARIPLKRQKKEGEDEKLKSGALGNEEEKKEEEVFDELTCPILAWYEYMQRTKAMRGTTTSITQEEVDVPGRRIIKEMQVKLIPKERLFLKPEPPSEGAPHEAMTDMETMNLVKAVLEVI
jgi:hypothetical protein